MAPKAGQRVTADARMLHSVKSAQRKRVFFSLPAVPFDVTCEGDVAEDVVRLDYALLLFTRWQQYLCAIHQWYSHETSLQQERLTAKGPDKTTNEPRNNEKVECQEHVTSRQLCGLARGLY